MADLYMRAARALQGILARRGSIKALTAQGGHGEDARSSGNIKRVLALVVNTLSFRTVLQEVLDTVDIAKHEPKWFGEKSPLNRTLDSKPPPLLSFCVLLVLTHDLLFSKRGIQAARAWQPKVKLERYKSQLHSALVRIQLRHGKKHFEELRSGAEERAVAARIPRWVRINTLKASSEEVVSALEKEGFTQGDGESIARENVFIRSSHVPNVLAFHPKATSALMRTVAFKQGDLILQDLASCFPAAVLDPRAWGAKGHVSAMDATSAPGNKTSHLSALLSGQGTLTALERAPQRYTTLVRLLGRAGCLASSNGNVYPKKLDFLTLVPEEHKDIAYMLLDPSCSGSGIVNRLDYLTGNDDEQDNVEMEPDGKDHVTKLAERLASLAGLQEKMIRHAMSFPGLQRFTYSTCSIHEEENEAVVMRSLASPVAIEGGWTLAPRRETLPTWPERGHVRACGGDEAMAESMIRCVPGGRAPLESGQVHTNATNGFFVCCFIRSLQKHKKRKTR